MIAGGHLTRSAYTEGVLAAYQQAHARVLTAVGDLTEEQLTWPPGGSAHAIAWSLWHLARWADHLQATLPAMTPVLATRLGRRHQIWLADDLAAQWRMAPGLLGYEESGMTMDDAEAAHLALPGKEVLLDYVRCAFAAAVRAVGAVDDHEWLEPDATSAAYYAGLGQEPHGARP